MRAVLKSDSSAHPIMGQQLLAIVPLLGLSIAGALLMFRRRRRGIPKDWGAISEKVELLPPPPPPPPAAPHPLTGLTFVIKDIFDVEGHVAGFGSPAWKASHAPAAQTAPCVRELVEAGAQLVGKTHMDEMAYSIFGENKALGTPVNPVCPDHVPGGSSSGSAVAISADLADFALGTDTAGSIRIPAAFCGVLGYRPSHGAISAAGCVPMAPSLDTVGVFAADPAVLRHVGHILLRQPFTPARRPLSLYLADDLFDLCSIPRRHVTEAVLSAGEQLFGPIVKYVQVGQDLLLKRVPAIQHFLNLLPPPAAPQGNSSSSTDSSSNAKKAAEEGKRALQALAEAMKLLQRHEFRTAHQAWVQQVQPKLQADVQVRVQAAMEAEPEALAAHAAQAQLVREQLRAAIADVCKSDGLIALPVTPDFPPKLRAKPQVLDAFRASAMLLVAPGSMSGCPQVTVPIGRMECSPSGLPLAVGLMARHGADRFLLDSVTHFAPAVQDAYKAVLPKLNKSQASASSSAAAQPVLSQAEIAKEKGNKAYKQKKYQEAVDHYTTAIRHDSKNATYYSNRAMAYLNLHNFEQVEADCTAALSLDKKNVKAMLRRGTAREMLGFYPEAFEDFSQALILEPTNKTALEAVTRMKESGIA
ncbi:unnamed protein product [Closterium sp. Yama58-4]|nr:unnamed protein product [Closterium sp. Yama58-4]